MPLPVRAVATISFPSKAFGMHSACMMNEWIESVGLVTIRKREGRTSKEGEKDGGGGGQTFTCTGVGARNSRLCMALTSFGSSPNVSNDILE